LARARCSHRQDDRRAMALHSPSTSTPSSASSNTQSRR
jgi:hypothetical protein